jgi:hypothetical protein
MIELRDPRRRRTRARGAGGERPQPPEHRRRPRHRIVTRDGHIKILDFGLAKLAQGLETTDLSDPTGLPTSRAGRARARWSGPEFAAVRYGGARVRLEYPLDRVIYETTGNLGWPRVSPSCDAVAFVDHPYLRDDRGAIVLVGRAGRVRARSGRSRGTTTPSPWTSHPTGSRCCSPSRTRPAGAATGCTCGGPKARPPCAWARVTSTACPRTAGGPSPRPSKPRRASSSCPPGRERRER